MLNTVALSHDYRGSGLPRRSFHVDATTTVDGETCHRAYAVTAPDPLRAENIVRYHLRQTGHLFSISLVREVTEDWDRRVSIVIPGWFEHAL